MMRLLIPKTSVCWTRRQVLVSSCRVPPPTSVVWRRWLASARDDDDDDGGGGRRRVQHRRPRFGNDADTTESYGYPRRRNYQRGGTGGSSSNPYDHDGPYDEEKRDGPKLTGMEAPEGTVVWDVDIHDPRVLGLGWVTEERKDQIYKLHDDDPKTWHIEALAQRFQLNQDRIRAIIVLRRRVVEMRARGERLLGDELRDDKDRTIAQAAEDMLKEKLATLTKEYGVRVENAQDFDTRNYEGPTEPETRVRFFKLDDGEDEEEVEERQKAKVKEASEAIARVEAEAEMAAAARHAPPLETYQPPDANVVEPPPEEEPRQAPGFRARTNLKRRSKKKKIFVIKDITGADTPDAPTMTALGDAPLRPTTPDELINRTWTPVQPYVETMSWADGKPLGGTPPPPPPEGGDQPPLPSSPPSSSPPPSQDPQQDQPQTATSSPA